MSGICGIHFYERREVDRGELDPVLEALKRRGPDRTELWRSGPVVFGHNLLATTPEAQIEKQPWVHAESGCVITADARIDNREQLAAALRLHEKLERIGDGELILLSYLKWGNDCPRYLLGDFAFVIWDPHRQGLFGARDQMGMRQLIYTRIEGKLFAFATEPSALVRHPLVPRRINEVRIIDYLEDIDPADLTSTYYRNVLRLPPGHTISVDRRALRVESYYDLDATPCGVSFNHDRDYEEAFRDIFTASVKSRLRSAKPVGAMLSGGIDSGSVCGVASRQLSDIGQGPLKTFSAISSNEDSCPETSSIREMGNRFFVDSTLISIDHLPGLYEEMERLRGELEEPVDQMTLLEAVYISARRKDVNVMLDGGASDNILGGDHVITNYLRQGQFGRAVREARGWEEFSLGYERAWNSLARAAAQIGTPHSLKMVRRHLIHLSRVGPRWRRSVVNSSYAKRYGRAERIKAHLELASHRQSKSSERAFNLRHPFMIMGRESYDRLSSRLAIEARDPYCDRRLVEFVRGLPPEQLVRHGWPKWILRKAMKPIVPATVRWKPGRVHLGWQFDTKLAKDRATGQYEHDVFKRLKGIVKAKKLMEVERRAETFGFVAASPALSTLATWLESLDE